MKNYTSTSTQDFRTIKARKDGSDKDELFETNVLPAIKKHFHLERLKLLQQVHHEQASLYLGNCSH